MASRPRDIAYLSVLAEAIEVSRARPGALEAFVLSELLEEQAETLSRLGRFDEALASMREAVAEELSGQPDSRCRIAEILMRAGRVEEAAPIWAQVRIDTPDDVWVYNNAGLEYADVGDHSTALAWLTDGLRLAIDTDDPERLVAQLAGLRRECQDALSLPADDLQAEAAQFVQAAEECDRKRRELLHERHLDRLQATLDEQRQRDERARVAPGRMPDTVAWSWFPADEYPLALRRWPGLTEPGGLAENNRPHPEYCRALQAKLVEASDAGMTGIRIAPIRVDAAVGVGLVRVQMAQAGVGVNVAGLVIDDRVQREVRVGLGDDRDAVPVGGADVE